jgi:thioredoxin 1
MATVHFDKKSFDEAVKGDKPAMVDFFATWCGPCRMAGQVLDELAKEYQDKMVIGKVDVDEEKDLAGEYGVMSIPTVIIFKEGKEVERITGFPGKEGYEETIQKLIK